MEGTDSNLPAVSALLHLFGGAAISTGCRGYNAVWLRKRTAKRVHVAVWNSSSLALRRLGIKLIEVLGAKFFRSSLVPYKLPLQSSEYTPRHSQREVIGLVLEIQK